MGDGRTARIAALRRALATHEIDALLVTSIPNIRYLTGFSGSSAMVVVSMHEVVLLTDFRYQTQVTFEVGAAARTIIELQSLWTRLWSVLPELTGTERIGFESSHVVHRDFQRIMEGGTRWQWRPTSDLIESLRERKDADELARIRRAADIACGALHEIIPRVRPGMTELAVAGMLEHALRDGGSEGFPFETIVAAGPRSALPHARASGNTIAAGDFLLIDFGAEHAGYCSDITRTFVVGRATPEQRVAYDIVREAQAVAVGGLTVGMSGKDADALARSYIERSGWGEAFGHSLGHGIGLEVHEGPRLSRLAEAPLPAGAVVTVEPGVYRAGWGGVRIEDDVLVGDAGPELLTHFPRELKEIG
ncbi:MAG TPA: Xaa-Pro peptidase family protein [Gemmatimonadaceae bacterium]|nr:Xaa-Pro peptidase family protein [Gemmatimonadaceae bacterium]